MASAKQADKTSTQAPAAESKNEVVVGTSMRLRLPYPTSLDEYAGIDKRTWGVLIDAVWPSAQTVEAVCLAISYCKSRNLDPLKRPIHIVPVWNSKAGADGKGAMAETIWPGIAELRTTAIRTGAYAGKDAAEFGPQTTHTFRYIDDRNDAVKETKEVTFAEWCSITVYRMVQGQRCAFVGPKVYWLESYATKSKFNEIPNDMWSDRRSGQLEKCAEAAALRAAFPEELGGEYTAEEMYGRTIDHAPAIERSTGPISTVAPNGEVSPPRPQRSDFDRQEATKPPAKEKDKAKRTPAPPADDPPAEIPAKGAQKETVRERGDRLLTLCKTEADVDGLMQSIAEELHPEDYPAWQTVCEARRIEISEAAK